MTTDADAVRTVLTRFQELYRARDVERLGEALDLFVPGDEAEMIGTEAAVRGDPDWAVGSDSVRAVTEWDWRFWWEVELDVAGSRVTVEGDVAWVTMAGSLVQSKRGYAGSCAFVRQTTLPQLRVALEDEDRTLEQRLADVAHVAGARVRELTAPPGRRRALSFSAVLVRRGDSWLIHTTHWAIAAE